MSNGDLPSARIGTEAVKAKARLSQAEFYAKRRRLKAQMEAKSRLAYDGFPGTREDLIAYHRRLRDDFYVREALRREAA